MCQTCPKVSKALDDQLYIYHDSRQALLSPARVTIVYTFDLALISNVFDFNKLRGRLDPSPDHILPC